MLEPLVRMALLEDLGRAGDLTTDTIVPADATDELRLMARQDGVLAGLDLARLAFTLMDGRMEFDVSCADGTRLEAGMEIARIRGKSRAILSSGYTAFTAPGHHCSTGYSSRPETSPARAAAAALSSAFRYPLRPLPGSDLAGAARESVRVPIISPAGVRCLAAPDCYEGYPGGLSSWTPSTHEVADIPANAQKLALVQATDDIADHGRHDPGGAGHPEVRSLLHHETRLGQPQRLEEIVVHPGVSQFHHEITQGAAMFAGVWGLLQGFQHLERLGVECFGTAEAQGRQRGGVGHSVTSGQVR